MKHKYAAPRAARKEKVNEVVIYKSKKCNGTLSSQKDRRQPADPRTGQVRTAVNLMQILSNAGCEVTLDPLNDSGKPNNVYALQMIIKTDRGDVVLDFDSKMELSQSSDFQPFSSPNAQPETSPSSVDMDSNKRVIQMKNVMLHPGTLEVIIHGDRIKLHKTQFRLLYYLASRPGWIFSRDNLMTHICGYDYLAFDRTIDVQIAYLRKKLGRYRHLIETVRGIGYRFNADF